MAHSLVSFTFNSVKAGKIIRHMRDEHDLSNDDIEDLTGIPAETVKNLIRGTAGLTLERVFKLCVVFQIPLESFVALMVEGEDIDFADQILMYDPTQSKSTPITDASVTPIADTIPDAVAEAALSAPHAPPILRPEEYHATNANDLRAEIARQDYIIRQLLDILAKR